MQGRADRAGRSGALFVRDPFRDGDRCARGKRVVDLAQQRAAPRFEPGVFGAERARALFERAPHLGQARGVRGGAGEGDDALVDLERIQGDRYMR